MAVNTIGSTTANSISAKIVSAGAITVPFNIRAGDTITVRTDAGGFTMGGTGNNASVVCMSGGSVGNTFAVKVDGTTYTFIATTACGSLTIRAVPYNFANTTFIGAMASAQFNAMATDGNQTILVNNNQTALAQLPYSTDGGLTWSQTTVPSDIWNGLGYSASGTRWIILSNTAGNSPRITTNLAGAWTTPTGGTWVGGAFNKIAIGGANSVVYNDQGASQNGNYSNDSFLNWTNMAYGFTPRGIRYLNDRFVAWSGTGQQCWTSTNGATWTNRTVSGFTTAMFGASNAFDDAYFSNGVYYLVGSGVVATSTDGATWSYLNNLYPVNRGIGARNFTTDGTFAIYSSSASLGFGLLPTSQGVATLSVSNVGVDSTSQNNATSVWCAGTQTLVSVENTRQGVLRTTFGAPVSPIGLTITNLTQGYTTTY